MTDWSIYLALECREGCSFKLISKDADIECGWCNKSNKAEVWNSISKAECTSREMKRAYKDIFNEDVFNKNKKVAWYKCPKCGLWSKGTQLKIVNTNNSRYRALGGEPVIRTINNKTPE